MKRIISIFLSMVLLVMALAACSGTNSVYTGLGVTTNIKNSVSAENGKDGTAQVDSAVAAITLDSNGTIIRLSIDEPQTRVVFNSKGKITSGLSSIVQSKLEKGDNYGMSSHSGIGKEWFQQIAAFEQWAIGKTVDEVLSLQTKKVDEAHLQVPDAPELIASVTITVGDYLRAIEKAAANAKPATTSETFKTGLGIVTRIANSTDATADKEGYAQVDSIIAVVSVSDKGKISACSIDIAQTQIPFATSGELTADLSAEIKTLAELGGDYALQAAAFADWTIGKTVKEIQEAKPSTISIDVSDFITAIEKAVANGK